MSSPFKRPPSPTLSTDPSNPKRTRSSSIDPDNRIPATPDSAAPAATPGSIDPTMTSQEARLLQCEKKIEILLWNAVRVGGMQDAVVGVMNDMTDVRTIANRAEMAAMTANLQTEDRHAHNRIASRGCPFPGSVTASPRCLVSPLATPLPPPLVPPHPYEDMPVHESAYSLFNAM
ncbi:hypothetical protein BDN72DRAFT_863239 [Pluteus cervinus]|uniref:Uncharacterized protein n=1 Tax=Pluteus cervinus TaxID=181527 RepID=A0ACD3A897_9AGAR|nr:hypothetical protein BDN72DRAFT_863239 [Pluteus cervinus]